MSNKIVKEDTKKVSPKIDKDDAVKFITEFVDLVNDKDSELKPEKSLMDRIAYTLKKAAETPVTEILKVKQDVNDYLISAGLISKPVLENSNKPVLKAPKKDEPKTENDKREESLIQTIKDTLAAFKDITQEDIEAIKAYLVETKQVNAKNRADIIKGQANLRLSERTSEPKKPPILTNSKKGLKVSPKVDTVPPVSKAGIDNIPMAVMFPKEIEVDLTEGKTTLVAAYNKYQTFDEVIKALGEEKTIYFAAYWTKAHIKKFEYEGTRFVKAPKEGFAYDLDVMQVVLPLERIKRLVAVSVYTDAVFHYNEDALSYVEDIDPRDPDGKKKFKVRVSSGMEFEVYVPKE